MLFLDNLFITGATGFIGQRLLILLESNSQHVGVLVRDKNKFTNNFSQSRNSHFIPNLYEGDLLASETLRDVMKGYQTVFHLAGYTHFDDADSSVSDGKHWKITAEGTQNILNEAIASGVEHFIFVSSVKAAGEYTSICINEDHLDYPETGYGRAKLAAEQLVLNAGKTTTMKTTVLRLPLVYGPGNKGNLPKMIKAIYRKRFPPLLNIKNKRSMVHVDDVISAMLLAVSNQTEKACRFYVTDERVYSTSDIYRMICLALGRKIPTSSTPIWMLAVSGKLLDVIGLLLKRRFAFCSAAFSKLTKSACFDSSKIRNELGYVPRYTLNDALPLMVTEVLQSFQHDSLHK